VRVLERPGTSLRQIVQQAADRYRVPIALTEVHIGCTEDEQVRWLHEAWTICKQLEASGVPVHAVTSWAMLGSYDWNTLLTRGGNHYESGAFCVRSGKLRPTAVADYIRAVTHDRGAAELAALAGHTTAWWHQPGRLLHAARVRDSITSDSGVDLPAAVPALD